MSLLTEGRDKHYKTDVRRALARSGWRVNDASNQELGAKPPPGWPVVGEILERSKNASKTSIRTITGSHGVVRYLELIAQGATGSSAGRVTHSPSPPRAPPQKRRHSPSDTFAAPVWKFAKLLPTA